MTLLLLVTLVLGAAPMPIRDGALLTPEQRAEQVRSARGGEARIVQHRSVQEARKADRVVPDCALAAWTASDRCLRHDELARRAPSSPARPMIDDLGETLVALPPPLA